MGSIKMNRPLIQINDVVREMDDIEYAVWQSQDLERQLAAAIQVRKERNVLLVQTDWTQLADAPVDVEAWATYRQALRDVPNQQGFPWSVEWPEKP